MGRIVLTPSELNDLSRRLGRAAIELERSTQRIDRATSAARLNADDPALRRGDLGRRLQRHRRQVAGLGRRMEERSDLIGRTARQGLAADRIEGRPTTGVRPAQINRCLPPPVPIGRVPVRPRSFAPGALSTHLAVHLAPIATESRHRAWLADGLAGLSPTTPATWVGRSLVEPTLGLVGRGIDWGRDAAQDAAEDARTLWTTTRNGLERAYRWGRDRLVAVAAAAWRTGLLAGQVILTETLQQIRRQLNLIKFATASPLPWAAGGSVLFSVSVPIGGVAGGAWGWRAHQLVEPRVRDFVNRTVTPRLVHGVFAAADPLIPDGVPSGDLDAVQPGLGAGHPRRWPTRSSGQVDGPQRFAVTGAADVDRGRGAVVRALEDTASPGQIQADEFEVVDHGHGRYTIVLPGVTDLSNPQPGLNPHNRSVRDTDVAAARSASSTNLDDNAYARMVRDYITDTIEPGASLAFVGHSFGADTAVDLAADPGLADAYRVSHVVAAAYHSEPQLDAVPDGVAVLVLQNANDVPVLVEEIGHVPSVSQLLPRLRPNVVLEEFEGGYQGMGHHQANYIDHLDAEPTPAVAAFFESWSRSGFADDGPVTAVDISVPGS
jgi:hypothetical protein